MNQLKLNRRIHLPNADLIKQRLRDLKTKFDQTTNVNEKEILSGLFTNELDKLSAIDGKNRTSIGYNR